MNDDNPRPYRVRRLLFPEGYRWTVGRWILNVRGAGGFYLMVPRKDGAEPKFPTWAEAMADVEARLRESRSTTTARRQR